ncbi:MAG: orotidine-5'-phosphate decarboxylase [Candidatus Diapherotrites archaeon]|nr:orotidine-5'-phosphate decarboxylase [Candidatus Diapherotrites archaeon]
MNYLEFLKKSAEKNNSIVCFGLDPVLEKIPIHQGNAEEKISNFYGKIIDACSSEGILPGAFKPNYAFFAQYGFPGLKALKNVCEKVKSTGVPLILDAKRGDIGKTSEAYAKEAFEFWEADCLTVAPYMGEDSVMPFVKWCEEKDKGIYVLNRTSNSGSKDFQNLQVEGKELFLHVSEKIVDWGKKSHGGLGAVVGATSLQELEQIAKFFSNSGQKIPLLIPGVGSQGGSAKEVIQVLKKTGYDLRIARINSSSGLNYAFETQGTKDFASAAVKALKDLNSEIGEFI